MKTILPLLCFGVIAGSCLVGAAGKLPPFTVERWVNSTPLTVEALRGKVVLLDIWEYTCINWIRTSPYVKAWHRDYAALGLVVVGLHAPEFEFGKRADNIDRGIRDHGLRGLSDRAKKDEVRQEIVDSRGPSSSYLVRFPASAISIAFYSPATEPDYYVALLLNDQGKSVQTLAAVESDLEDWRLLGSLLSEANRAITGWDKLLADAEAAIQSTGPVGKNPDDIPF